MEEKIKKENGEGSVSKRRVNIVGAKTYIWDVFPCCPMSYQNLGQAQGHLLNGGIPPLR